MMIRAALRVAARKSRRRKVWPPTEAALVRLVTDPGDKSRAAPKLNGRTFENLLGLFDRFAVGKELQRIVG